MEDEKIQVHYAPTAKWIHWLVALIVIPMVLGSFYLDDIPKLYRGDIIGLHKSLGLTILVLIIIRMINIYIVGRPPLPIMMPFWEKILSRVVQYMLYLCLILMPLCGWIMSSAAGRSPRFWGMIVLPFPGVSVNKGLSDLMFNAHHTLALIIIGLLVLHIAGALKHLLIDKDSVFASIWPNRRS